jgi:3D (Asp-Asp-Asp) domain-containing protein
MEPFKDSIEYQEALRESQLGFLKSYGNKASSNVEEDPWDVTFYCPCPTCCGKNSPHVGGHGLTASGKPPVEGMTVAADWKLLPKGSRIDIEGLGERQVMDTGSGVKGRHVDVFMKNHEEAKKMGRLKRKVKRLQ